MVKIKVSDWAEFIFIGSFWWKSLSWWCALERANEQACPSVIMDRHMQLASGYSLQGWSRILGIWLLTWGLVAQKRHFPTTCISPPYYFKKERINLFKNWCVILSQDSINKTLQCPATHQVTRSLTYKWKKQFVKSKCFLCITKTNHRCLPITDHN